MEPLQKILSVAIELFKNYGFKSVTMDDIARRAGISKKTLYLHFANKEEVVMESVLWEKSCISTFCNQMQQEAANALEAMVKVLAMFDNINRQINPMAFHELQRFYPEAYKKFREMLLQTDVAILSDNMKRGMAEGIYRSGLNTDILARYRLETSMLVLQPNLIVNERNDLLTVALEIGEHFLYGIITPKGEQLYCQYKQQYLNK